MRKPVMQTKLRNLISGKILEYNFKQGERVEEADVERKPVSFLYAAGDEYTFMDNADYEQISFTKQQLGDQTQFLKDGLNVILMTFNGAPINIQLPPKVDLKVVTTVEGAKGDSAQGRVTKPAQVETGATILVPLFIQEGEIIRVNTETSEYVERVSDKK